MTEATEHKSSGESQVFQADVAKLLHLMVHSIYSDRDIFLRELLSNGADACEKLRYEALAHPELAPSPFAIKIRIDKEGRRLIIEDNGVGMSRADLADSLGTIARSGTKAFLEALGEQGQNTKAEDQETETEADKPQKAGPGTDLIGQFGIGFYSAFMVADHVDVTSRRAGSNEAFNWSSDGKGTFTIVPVPVEDAPAPGTRVMLHINEASQTYLEPYEIERIVREHSSALAVPIEIIEKNQEGVEEPRRLTDGAALWTKPKSAITPEEYTEFYRDVAGQYDEPALTIHWRAEGRHEYTVLAFIPNSRPFDLFDPARKGRGRLYVRRVLITQDAELVPHWLRFVRLVVDSADLPLNVSREMIQESPVFAAIKKGVTNRILQELTKLADSEPEKFAKIWEHFGAVIKEGLYEDAERRDSLFKIARFATSSHAEGGRTLKDYVAGLRENQTAIYYLLGDDLKRLAVSPQLEGFRKRGIEVLLLADHVDAFWVSTAVGFDGKPFKSITQGAADIKNVPSLENEEDKAAEPPPGGLAALFAFMKQTLGDMVEDVRASDRLSESPACLIASDLGPDRQLERMLAEHGQLGRLAKPVLEINPTHPLIKALNEDLTSPDKEKLEDIVWLLLDEARLMEGDQPADAPHFASRLTRILLKAAQKASA
ncbi:molecular chaperone HtpG [Beijerinckia indica]|uniref:Chaperone protein HtpG n=1 Tax=Beijerinckia indica subsp. indica (strain ATCC 9039 / DSM 1715 / NCIMB 8712) TaxID=395963 RepID=B2IH62_BEII9|nr:molecular chaperone HtpG [Beijerinckia indica]ACB94476.1 heat shock protein Hsp90 [Beijerinckia indica subsp. indica ATCC 9039]